MIFKLRNRTEKTIYCYVAEYNTKFGQRIHKGFGKVHYELMSLLEQNLPVYQACLTQTAMDTQAS
ncbi:hypothetical protein ACWOA0_04470 [Ignavigranum ruoffiae]|uniref:hypothetical protein n=1 Tax=Ignavigranum ruoffiae TaxID=89093 RepID=UPI00204C33FE|nr:hypothetical protein [Ignavigranum ruoffiae]UPQ85228.1 hypothetical protein M0R79_06110 [Ignavigranum ruoffiae]